MKSLRLQGSSGLLVAASAGLLAQSASAANYNDATSDLNDSSPGTPVSFPAITGVTPAQIDPSDNVDVIDVGNLLAGSFFDVFATWTAVEGPNNDIHVLFLDTLDNPLASELGSTGFLSGNGNRQMTVPANGIVRIETSMTGEGTGGWDYTLSFEGSQAPVPEPATTAAAAAAALAALLELRRRRAK
jgi:hypothetical protein